MSFGKEKRFNEKNYAFFETHLIYFMKILLYFAILLTILVPTPRGNPASKERPNAYYSGKNGSHLAKKRKSRCLLVSVDNRNLNENLQSDDYVSINAAITHSYAKYHGYDYLYLQNNVDG